MLCVIGRVSDSGVGVREISIIISSRCCSRLSPPPCVRLCGLISNPAGMFAASSDWSWVLWFSDIFVVVIISVGHLRPSRAIFLGRCRSFVWKYVMLFDIRPSSFCAGLSGFSLISFLGAGRCISLFWQQLSLSWLQSSALHFLCLCWGCLAGRLMWC